MKVVILCGGFGTRISEESHLKPKPMIEIGDKPILWHIMKGYSHYGSNEFILCLGYKGYVIKEYFDNYFLHTADVTYYFDSDRGHGEVRHIHNHKTEPWEVTLVETGQNTATAGRLKQVKDYIGDDTFMLTYGDGVSNIDIKELLAFHYSHDRVATITTVSPTGRWGIVNLRGDCVKSFKEKPNGQNSWINAGFMVMEPEVIDYIDGDNTSLENDILPRLAKEDNLAAYKHTGFWHPMDTLRDKNHLEELWKAKPPWRIW